MRVNGDCLFGVYDVVVGVDVRSDDVCSCRICVRGRSEGMSDLVCHTRCRRYRMMT